MEQNDQRNIMLAFLLAFGVFILYSTFVLQPQEKARKDAMARSQAEQQVANPATPGNPNAPVVAAIRNRDDIINEQTQAGQRVTLDGPAVDGSVSLKGSRIDDVALKGFYETVADKRAHRTAAEVHLMQPEGTEAAFYATVNWAGTPGLPTEESVWTREGTGSLTKDAPLVMSYTGAGVSISRKISIDDNYMFSIADTLTNTGAAPISVQPVAVIRQNELAEHLKPAPQAHAGVIGVFGEEKNQMVKYADLAKDKGVQKDVNKGWIGLTTKYWMAAAIPEQGEPVTMRASDLKQNGRVTFQAGYTTSPYTVPPGQSVSKTTRIFAGAKRVAVLDAYEKGGIPSFTDAVDWSWLFFITKPFFWMLQAFQGWFGSFGLAILALTVVVKTAFFPLQYKMYQGMSKMRKLAPQVEALKTRFGADKARLQQEQMKLYQQEKVNPLAGCLPLIPQMFVFYSLYHTLYVTIEMRQTPFLGIFPWVQDMSAPDPTSLFNLFGLIPWNPSTVPVIGSYLMIGVWPLLYGATMVLLQNLSPPVGDPTQRAIMRWLPVVFLIFFALSPAGLVIYWCWSNLITLTQQYFIMRRTGVETQFDTFLKKRFGKKELPPAA